jgi:putative tryptophan/tyrosine transport system substrate-binding protein
MKRREFIAGLGSAAAWPVAARAQQAERVRRIGLLMANLEDDTTGPADVAAFRRGLATLGWVEGRNYVLEIRWGGGNAETIERFAKELVALKPDVLLSRNSPATIALNKESGGIPIVFVNIAEPVDQGFVASFPRPGGKITGFTNVDATACGKMLQLLKESDPRIVRVGIMYNPRTAPFGVSFVRSAQSAGPALGVEPIGMPLQSEGDIEAAVATLARRPESGLIAIPDAFLFAYRSRLAAAAAQNHLPALYAMPGPFGGLMTYATDTRDLMRRAAEYVDRILKGADPADLPVQAPTRFNLVINRKVADSLGLIISPQLSVFADEIIE